MSFALDIEKFADEAIAAVENTRRIFIGNLAQQSLQVPRSYDAVVLAGLLSG